MNNKVNWVIDKYIFEEYENKLMTVIKDSGHNVFLFDDTKRDNDIKEYMTKRFTDKDIVIFHGSIQHGRRVAKTSMYPGIYLTLDNYECFKYYGHFGDYLLNSNYIMMGLNDVARNQSKLYDMFLGNGLFIRPSDGFKSFPGQMLHWDGFRTELSTLIKSYGGLDTDTLCVLSPEQDIEEEYRFIVVNGAVVSGSMYSDSNSRRKMIAYYDKICENKNALNFAECMAKIYQPDPVYSLDVCRLSTGEYKMVEANSFCCGSLYGNDYRKVVDAVNELCIADYQDVYMI